MNAPQPAPVAVPVEVLTDEELEVLRAGPGVVIRPHLDALPDAERVPACRAAYRSLRARGVLDQPTEEAIAAAAGHEAVEVQVREDVLSVVALRQVARAVVCVARSTARGQDFWYAHVVGEVVLLEQVSEDGFHRFALAATEDLGDLLVGAAVHAETGDGCGPAVTVTDVAEPPPGLIDRLGAAALRADVVVRTATEPDPVLTGVFTGPGGAWLLTARSGSAEPPTAVPTSRAALVARVRALAVEAVAAGALVDEGDR
ncbi:hypothetical protein [Cellulomonas sp. Marseille-Q8402]